MMSHRRWAVRLQDFLADYVRPESADLSDPRYGDLEEHVLRCRECWAAYRMAEDRVVGRRSMSALELEVADDVASWALDLVGFGDARVAEESEVPAAKVYALCGGSGAHLGPEDAYVDLIFPEESPLSGAIVGQQLHIFLDQDSLKEAISVVVRIRWEMAFALQLSIYVTDEGIETEYPMAPSPLYDEADGQGWRAKLPKSREWLLAHIDALRLGLSAVED
jgi:hypothetical protein